MFEGTKLLFVFLALQPPLWLYFLQPRNGL